MVTQRRFSMYCASDYRSMARRALKNFWWLAVGVTLLATVLGGGTIL